MEWLDMALQNPMENAPLWIIILMASFNFFVEFFKTIFGFFKSNNETIQSENLLQSQLLRLMTTQAKFEERLLTLHEKDIQQLLRDVAFIKSAIKAIVIALKAKGFIS